MTVRTQHLIQTPTHGLGKALHGLLAWVARVQRVAAERRELADLSDAQMRDMGIDEEARRRELQRPFWDVA